MNNPQIIGALIAGLFFLWVLMQLTKAVIPSARKENNNFEIPKDDDRIEVVSFATTLGVPNMIVYNLDEKKFVVGSADDLQSGKKYIILSTTDPEDLDCTDITDLLQKAYEMGADGE